MKTIRLRDRRAKPLPGDPPYDPLTRYALDVHEHNKLAKDARVPSVMIGGLSNPHHAELFMTGLHFVRTFAHHHVYRETEYFKHLAKAAVGAVEFMERGALGDGDDDVQGETLAVLEDWILYMKNNGADSNNTSWDRAVRLRDRLRGPVDVAEAE